MNFSKLFLLIIGILFSFNIYAQSYEIDETYKVEFFYTYSEEFDSLNGSFHLVSCSKNLSISIQPSKPINGNYNLHDNNGIIKSSTNGHLWILSENTSGFVVKDGEKVIFSFNREIDTEPRFKVVLTDDELNEIANFSPTYLNSINLSMALKNLITDTVGYCVPYYNYIVNNEWLRDIDEVELKNNDELCVFLDATENCTKGCFREYQTCYVVKEEITANLKPAVINIELYPTIASQKVSIKDHQEINNYIVLSANGAEVLSGALEGNEIDISTLSSGFYIIKAKSNNSIFTGKFIKQ
jgi:hypothetical protein